MPRYKTRRDQIISEQQSGLRRIIIILVLFAAILIFAAASCSSCGSEPEQSVSGQTTVTQKHSPLPDTITGYPKLINSDFTLSPSYVPDDLTTLFGIPDGTKIRMRTQAARAFEQMYAAMLEDGLAMIPLSGYRSYSEQTMLLDYNISLYTNEGMPEDEARKKVLQTIAPPGASEHQSGLAIDVTTDGTTQHDFQQTPQGKWLCENACRFGFIIRYPEDKVSITGIGYEPWHLRYVGIEHAVFITENKLCLEEYIVIVQKNIPDASEEA